ncbi:MAG: M1 family metallopeptidase [Akkermansiaceae bacterium]
MKLPFLFLVLALPAFAHPIEFHKDPFRQLEEVWPTPTESRIASGAPGPKYWQQRADYDIKIALDEKKDLLTGSASVVYHNKSPHTLKYLWMQLDRNKYTPGSMGHQSTSAPSFGSIPFNSFESMLLKDKFDGGFHIDSLVDSRGAALNRRIVDTMMRVDLPTELKPGQKFSFKIAWHYIISDSRTTGGRSNMEKFEKGGKIFEIAQWFPRLCAYTDVRGWQNKAFLGRGEFALEFGDYKVAITAPDNHIVSATGVLKNPKDCLKPEWQDRLKKAESETKPIFIITPEEAAKNEKTRAKGTKTWVFEAKNVRDFAWASSKKFIWDALRHKLVTSKKPVWAMSFYPNEAEPLWSKYSTHSIIHTLNVYSKFTFDYPYPVAISVNGPVYGMEYPMICFNGPRPEVDGTYSEGTKNGLISVVIHEVGHNWFPMIVNSDERQWSWMDEGLNSFLQMLAEQEWRENYPSRGTPKSIIGYMRGGGQEPIMTNSEHITQFGANAYSKPAAGLSILRETILGRELFDEAFREYSTRWMFKSPEPSDFFRTMEDAAGVDLDWFWRSWFYTTNNVDIAVTGITRHLLDDKDPRDEAQRKKEASDQSRSENIVSERNKEIPKYVEENEGLKDFYDEPKKHKATEDEVKKFDEMIADLKPRERKLLNTTKSFTVVDFENRGGVIMPLLVELHLEGGKKQEEVIAAEIWKLDSQRVSKLFVTTKPVIKVVIDPGKQTADVNTTNNIWPPEVKEESFTLNPENKSFDNPMKEDRAKKEREAREKAEKAKAAKDKKEAEKKAADEKKKK